MHLRKSVGVALYLGLAWGLWVLFERLSVLRATRCLRELYGGLLLAGMATVLPTWLLLVPLAVVAAVLVPLAARVRAGGVSDAAPLAVGLGAALFVYVEASGLAECQSLSMACLLPLGGIVLAAGAAGAGATALWAVAIRSVWGETIGSAARGLLLSLYLAFPVVALVFVRFVADGHRRALVRTAAAGGLAIGLLAVWVAMSWLIRGRPRIRAALVGLAVVSSLAGTVAALVRETVPSPPAAGHPAGDRPNVVLVVIDSLRADALGAYGGTTGTPHLDALATESTVFERAITVAPWTMPSMASLFTSVYPSVHGSGVRYMLLDPGLPVLAERFRTAGYATAAVLNQHLYVNPSGFDRGLEEICSVECSVPFLLLEETPVGRFVAENLRLARLVRPATERVTAAASRALERLRPPFFLWIHWYDPHSPYGPPEAWRSGPPRVVFNGLRGSVRLGEIDTKQIFRGDYFVNEAFVEAVRGLYLDEVRFVDHEFGRLVEALKARGLWENTVLVVTADHGEEFYDHGRWDHGQSAYEEVLHVPLFVHGPGFAPGRVPQRVRNLDLFPTLLDLARIEYDAARIQGRSLLPILRGDERDDRTVLAESCLYSQEQKAFYAGRYKAVWFTYRFAPQLFDTVNDPRDTQDLAPLFAQRLAELRAGLDAQLAENAALRKKLLGKESQSETQATPEMIEQLKALGYVQ